jgi:GTP-binding protein
MIIKSAVYLSSHVDWRDLKLCNNHEYAFIGRSNVGKSSLINALTNKSNLALVSKKPGKTKTINVFLVNNQWNLVDLPGLGYAKVSQEEKFKWPKMIMNYLVHRKNLVNTFVLVDPNVPPQGIDIDFINHLGENSIPFTIVFTKTDKSSKTEIIKKIDAFQKELSKYWQELPPMLSTSAEKREGISVLQDYIEELNMIKFAD